MPNNCLCDTGSTGYDKCSPLVNDIYKLVLADEVASDGTRNKLPNLLTASALADLVKHPDPTKRFEVIEDVVNATFKPKALRTITFKNDTDIKTDSVKPFQFMAEVYDVPTPVIATINKKFSCGKKVFWAVDAQGYIVGSGFDMYGRKIQPSSFSAEPGGEKGGTKDERMIISFAESAKESINTWAVATLDDDMDAALIAVKSVALSTRSCLETSATVAGVLLPNTSLTDAISFASSTPSQFYVYNNTTDAEVTVTGVSTAPDYDVTITYAAQTIGDELSIRLLGGGFISDPILDIVE